MILCSGRAVDQGSEAKGMTVIVEVNKYAARRYHVNLRGTRLVVQSLCGLGLVGRGPL